VQPVNANANRLLQLGPGSIEPLAYFISRCTNPAATSGKLAAASTRFSNTNPQ
jgi:hypothetical protein